MAVIDTVSKVYRDVLERNGKDFNTVPDFPVGMIAKVKELVEADGYTIHTDGTVTK